MTGPLRVEGSTGDWIRPRLLPWGRHGCPAGAVVPTGFDRIVRVLHPAGDGRTWAEVAATNDRVMHGLVQWACILGDLRRTWSLRRRGSRGRA